MWSVSWAPYWCPSIQITCVGGYRMSLWFPFSNRSGVWLARTDLGAGAQNVIKRDPKQLHPAQRTSLRWGVCFVCWLCCPSFWVTSPRGTPSVPPSTTGMETRTCCTGASATRTARSHLQWTSVRRDGWASVFRPTVGWRTPMSWWDGWATDGHTFMWVYKYIHILMCHNVGLPQLGIFQASIFW